MKAMPNMTYPTMRKPTTPRKRAAATQIARSIILGIVALCAIPVHAQVPVALAPQGKMQFLDQNGEPLSGGILCTYQAGTTTQQATYTDSTGTVQNSNPIVLDSAGRANIWLTSLAYKFVLAGGGNCISPSNLQWTVDGIQLGVFASGNNAFSGNNSFAGTSTFNGPLIMNSGGAFNGSIGGNPTFTGNPNFSGNPIFTGSTLTLSSLTSANTPPASTGFIRSSHFDTLNWRNELNTGDIGLSVDGSDNLNYTNAIQANQFISTYTSGTPPFVVNSATNVPLLNASLLNGQTFSSGGPSAFSTLQVVSGVTSSSGIKHQRFFALCTTGGSIGNSCNSILAWTQPFGDDSYSVSCTPIDGSNTPTFLLVDKLAASVTLQILTFANVASTYNEVDCIALHD